MHDVLAVQGVLRRLVANIARGGVVVHAGLLGAQTIGVVVVGVLVIPDSAELALMNAAQLAAVVPHFLYHHTYTSAGCQAEGADGCEPSVPRYCIIVSANSLMQYYKMLYLILWNQLQPLFSYIV